MNKRRVLAFFGGILILPSMFYGANFVLANSEVEKLQAEIEEKNDRLASIEREIAAQKLFNFIPEDALISGYNVMFDLGFYDALIKKHIKKEYVIQHDILDILTIFRDLSTTSHKLSDAVSYYNVQTPNTHRALDDVIATFEVFKSMVNQDAHVIKTYTNIIGYPPFRSYYGIKLPHVKYLPQRSGLKDLSLVHKL